MVNFSRKKALDSQGIPPGASGLLPLARFILGAKNGAVVDATISRSMVSSDRLKLVGFIGAVSTRTVPKPDGFLC